MAARARAYQRVAQAEVAPTSADERLAALSGGAGFDLDDEDSELDDELNDHADDEGGDDDAKKRRTRQRSQRAARWSTKLHALLWILAAGSVAYAIDFFDVIFNDARVKRGFFQLALVCTGVNICITAYLAIYLPYIKKIHLEWSVYCPRMIPTATAVGVVATISYICALWPVWGLLTPGLLGLFFIGTLMTAHFLPAI